jgi:hypothetical protein
MKKFFLFIVFSSVLVFPQIIRVPQDQPTIQAAIDVSSDGDTVVVSSGRYYENIIFRGKNITVTSNYIFTNDPLDIDNTIIDGSQPANPDTASCVRIINNETRSARLIGFTLTGGKGTNWLDEHGAGIFREGGGILAALSSPTIKYNRIINNEAYDKTGVSSAGGGGIRAGDGNALIEGNFIAFNIGRYGGGLVLNYTGAVVRNNIFYKNSGGEDYGGGGIWVNNVNANPRLIINNTILENSSTRGGGGVYIMGSATAEMRNNIVYGNTGGTQPQIRVLTGSALTAEYNLVQGGYSGLGNVDADPMLTGSFTLTDNSPAIDAGHPNAVYNDIEDPSSAGNAKLPSRGTIRNDIGAFGGPFVNYIPQIPVSVKDETNISPDSFNLLQNYPNPFNPVTTIKFHLPAESKVTLEIYDLLGNEIALLADEYKEAGTHELTWDASHYPSGVYLCHLNTGSYTKTKKMIMMK